MSKQQQVMGAGDSSGPAWKVLSQSHSAAYLSREERAVHTREASVHQPWMGSADTQTKGRLDGTRGLGTVSIQQVRRTNRTLRTHPLHMTRIRLVTAS